MGMSAAQAKLLSLTARRSDINYQLSSLMRGKLDLMTQASNAAEMLANSKRNNNIFVMTTSDNSQTELSFNSLSKEGLTIIDAKGRTIVPSSYQSNPNALANILPASHPAVKSYDGDFVPMEKIKKNYVSIPSNSIPIFENIDETGAETKDVQAVQGEPTSVVQKFVEQTAMLTNLIRSDYGTNNFAESFYNVMNDNYPELYMVFGNNGSESSTWFNDDGSINENNAQYLTFDKRNMSDDVRKQINTLFRSEFGVTDENYLNTSQIPQFQLNKDLGATYTKYSDRQFQYQVDWLSSQSKISGRLEEGSSESNITYVSNAEQLITALLAGATYNEKTGITSGANIMLLNDIDLDEMLGDKMKTFIKNEIESLEGLDKGHWNRILDGSTNEIGTGGESRNWVNKYFNDNPTVKSQSGIRADVLKNIWNKYFSGKAENDNFNENFTNFIQIDNFTGAIGGGGFAINNLKMDATNGQFAGMFQNVDNGAVLDGIWMENAQVLSSGNGTNKVNAAILAKELNGSSWVNVTAKGQQFTIYNQQHGGAGNFDTQEFLKSASQDVSMKSIDSSKSDIVNAGWSIVAVDMRKDDEMEGAGYEPGFSDGLDAGYTDCGYAFQSYNNYAGSSYNSDHTGWRTVAADIEDNNYDKRLFSSTSGDNVSHLDAIKIDDSQNYYDNASTSGYYVVHKKNRMESASTLAVNPLNALLQNADKENSKIKFYAKEDVSVYEAPEGDSWKEGAKFDDGTEVDWDIWEICPNTTFDTENGTYTLSRKHGEETEEYLGAMSLLEFYKEQGVNVEIDENRESGFLTYSCYGYSVDVEYKDDLEKYNSDPYLYKVENNDSSIVIYEREKKLEVDLSQVVFIDDIEALLDQNIKNGVWFIQGASVADASKYERKSLDEIGIVETTDDSADAIAQAEYERKMREIELQEEKYDAQITELENMLKGIEQEIENQQKIVKQNIQSSFSTFAS